MKTRVTVLLSAALAIGAIAGPAPAEAKLCQTVESTTSKALPAVEDQTLAITAVTSNVTDKFRTACSF